MSAEPRTRSPTSESRTDESNRAPLQQPEPAGPPPSAEEAEQLRKRAALFKARPGFSYHCVQVHYQKGAKFGMVIKASEGAVYISKLDPKSLCAERLQVGDHLIDVDGVPIGDRETAKKLMLKRLALTRKVSFIVERAVSDEARLRVKAVLLSASTRTSSTAPPQKALWAARAAKQRNRLAQQTKRE